MQRVLAILAGCIVGVMVIFLSDMVVGMIYPFPANIDFRNQELMKEVMANAPPMSLVLVLTGGFLGGFAGGIMATFIMKLKDKIPAIIVGSVLTVLGIMNILFMPHPVWFNVISLFVYFAGSLSGFILYSKMKKNV